MNKLMSGKFRLLIAGLALAGAVSAADIRFRVERFEVAGENPLTNEETQAVLAGFAQGSQDLNGLNEAAKALEQAIREKGVAFHRVVVPPQKLGEGGVVQLKVVVYKLGEVVVEGNKHYSNKSVLGSLPSLRLGEVPDNDAIVQDLRVANNHPNKKLNLTYKQKAKTESLSAKVNVEDDRPEHFSFMMNTRGTRDTGGYRMALGFQHADFLGLDHVLNVNFAFSPDHFDEIKQYGFSYQLPVYATRGWVTGYWLRSDSDAGNIAGLFDVSGSGDIGGVHYTQYLPKWKSYEHWLDVGYDDKTFNNHVLFGRLQKQDLGVSVVSRPISLTYRNEMTWEFLRGGFNIGWARNLNGGPGNTDVIYARSRSGAKDDWDVWRYGAFLDVSLPAEWTFRNQLSGQYTDEPMIAAEQLGMAGMTTVRGYQEREVAADIGNIYRGEVWTPQWVPNVNFLAFYDHASGKMLKTLQGQKESLLLRSAGLGGRYNLHNNFVVAVDLAYAFDDARTTVTGPMTGTSSGSGKVNAMLYYRF